MAILLNMAQCKKCLQVIVSRHVHDYVQCKCGALAVDGGRDYLKRTAENVRDYIELTVYTEA